MPTSEQTPQQDETGAGAKYRFRNTRAGQGEIFDSSGELVWRYAPPPSGLNFLNGPLRGPDLILSAPDRRERLRIQRERTFPLSRFTITGRHSPLGSIESMSIISTYYAAQFANGSSWVFQIPTFTADFSGHSDDGAVVRVHIANELVWYALIDEGHDSPELIASLALMHSERCRW